MDKVTPGERRGLITLIIVLLLTAIIICWRDLTSPTPSIIDSGQSASGSSIGVSTLVSNHPEDSSAVKASPSSHGSTIHKSHGKKRSAKKKSSPANLPERRPKEETIN